MRVEEIRQVRTISAKTQKEFDKLYNSTSRELGASVTDVINIDATTARFCYTVTEKKAEDMEDIFMQHDARCYCSDCPFCEIGTDARRKTFPCKYSTYGETRIDRPACDVFYKEAIRRMREACDR